MRTLIACFCLAAFVAYGHAGSKGQAPAAPAAKGQDAAPPKKGQDAAPAKGESVVIVKEKGRIRWRAKKACPTCSE